jgi:hypothetical protein
MRDVKRRNKAHKHMLARFFILDTLHDAACGLRIIVDPPRVWYDVDKSDQCVHARSSRATLRCAIGDNTLSKEVGNMAAKKKAAKKKSAKKTSKKKGGKKKR